MSDDSLDLRAVREWVQQDDLKKRAAAAQKAAARRCDELEDEIMQEMIEKGVPKIPVTIKARDVDAEAAGIIEGIIEDSPPNPDDDTLRMMQARIVGALRNAGLLIDSSEEVTKTVFMGSRVWARPVATGTDDNGDPKSTDDDYRRACRALEAGGFGEYVQERFNIISLSSAVKEEVEHKRIVIPDGEDSTLAFDGTIIVTEKPQLQSRKVAKRA
jgi:hypothetical protein